MNSVTAVVKRNLIIYFRDPVGVFLSLLSAIVLLLLYLLFLGGLQVNHISDQMPNASSSDIQAFVYSWVFAGIVMITATTTGLGAMGGYVDDRATGRFKEFRVCPLRSSQLVLGYQLAAFLISVFMSTLILLLGYVIVGLTKSCWIAPLDLLRGFGLALFEALALSSLLSFLATFTATRSAFTALSTIVGTTLGFFAGAYLPVGLVSSHVASFINVLPFSPAAMLLRDPLAGHALSQLANGSSDADTALREYYGYTLSVGGTVLQTWWIIVGLAVMAVLFTTLTSIRMGKTIK
ncbi:MAG: ABC transporter permease [Propionibacteriaceae bacterium]|nr:ABC transporter permease [Propionibacteriaceae bacterium]